MNFWGYLLFGVWALMLDNFLASLPVHSDWGIVPMMTQQIVVTSLTVVSFVGAFLHLSVFGWVVGMFMIFEAVRTVFALYKWVKDMYAFWAP
jgi:hypothetical protein